MGLGSRTARQHDTIAAHTAGVDPSDYWEYKPGQAVMTVDGFAGVVSSVNDGPLSGTESYEVTLDGGLGGGEYTASQLSPKNDPAVKTAADDYPELGSILVDRPDIAPNTRWASLQTQAEHADWGHEQCPECGTMVDTNRGTSMEDHLTDEHGKDPEDYDHSPHTSWERREAGSRPKGEHGIESFDELEPNDGAESGVDEHGHLTWDGKSPGCRDTDEYSMFGQNDAVEKHAAYYTADELREWGRKALAEMGMTPEQAQAQMESVHGKTASWKDDYSPAELAAPCLMHHLHDDHESESKTHTTGDHFDWRESKGQDEFGKPKMQAYDGHGAWGCNNRECAEHPSSMYEQKPGQMPGWLEHDTHPDAGVRREVNKAMSGSDTQDANWLLNQQHQGPTHLSSFDPWGIVTTAAADPDFRFEVTAAWSDVRNKAKRIRSEGGVHVTLATEGMIHAEVKGDTHTYEAGLQRLPGRQAIQAWSCGCKWGAYHWGANDDFSRFAGRMCSHALALQYEAQSRGMFGREVRSDDAKPGWVPRMVVVKHDIDAGRDITGPASRVGHLDKPIETLALHAARNGETYYDTAMVLSTVGYDLSKFTPFGNREAMARWAAVNDAWGEPTPSAPQYGPGPTKPKDITENPASAGWASAPEPESWGQAGPSGLSHMVSSLDDDAVFEPEMGKEAFLPLLIPLAEGLMGAGAGAAAAGGVGAEVAGAGAARALVPQVVKTVAPKVVQHEVIKKMLPGDDDAPEAPEQAKPQRPGAQAPQPGAAHSPEDTDSNPLNYGTRADLHEEPEGALPSTDGDLEPEDESFVSTGSVEDIVAQFQATAGARALGGTGGGPVTPQALTADRDGMNIAAAAKMFLETGQKADEVEAGIQTTALKDFTLAERQKIIDEGADVRAGNFDRLDIKGTHYEPLEAALAAADNDEEWMD